jgi:hypothetical protein
MDFKRPKLNLTTRIQPLHLLKLGKVKIFTRFIESISSIIFFNSVFRGKKRSLYLRKFLLICQGLLAQLSHEIWRLWRYKTFSIGELVLEVSGGSIGRYEGGL